MNTAHSHHGDGHAGGRNQGNRQVSQAAGDHILIELFADAGEEQDGHGVTQGRADGVGNRLQEVIVGFNVDKGDTQDGTVRGDQGQVCKYSKLRKESPITIPNIQIVDFFIATKLTLPN